MSATFGDPATFAIRVTPLAGGPADPDPSAAATWASMELWALGQNLCQHRHRGATGSHRAINWPTINLARWLVHSWNDLFHQGRLPIPSGDKFDLRTGLELVLRLDEDLLASYDPDKHAEIRDAFVASHALQAASAGAALPDVYFLRDGDLVSVSWRKAPPVFDDDIVFDYTVPTHSVAGVPQGEVDVPARTFAEIVRAFVSWTLERLSSGSDDSALLASWLDSFEDRQAAWSGLIAESGLTPKRLLALGVRVANDTEVARFFDVDETWADAGTLADSSASPIAMGFRCLSPSVQDEDLLAIRRLILSVARSPVGFKALDSMAARVNLTGSFPRPFLHGYALAEALRSVLSNRDEPIDVKRLIQEQLHVPIREVELSDREIDGGCVCDDRHGPVILLNKNSSFFDHGPMERAVLAHELCHLLFDRRSAVAITVLSGPWASPRIEQKANAFAAELLLPVSGIRRFMGPSAASTPTQSDVKQMAANFGVGEALTKYQIDNRYWGKF